MGPIFAGSHVALPTPFGPSGSVDLEAFRGLIELHVRARTRGIVVCGTTGEAATLSERERRGLIHAAVEFAAGRLTVVAGVGTNATRGTVELARFASDCGADGLLVVTPYYNRPGRRGLFQHFGAVAEASQTPLMLYNVPGRTGVDLLPEQAAELAARFATVVALKEASPGAERARAVCAIPGLEVLCGEDAAIADYVRAGAVGAVSVVANLEPDPVAELIESAGTDPERARALEDHLAPLVRALFIETNPVPIKAALAERGLCGASVRGPLASLEEESRARLCETLAHYRQALAPQPLTHV